MDRRHRSPIRRLGALDELGLIVLALLLGGADRLHLPVNPARRDRPLRPVRVAVRVLLL
jgi:hypothetical protein